MSVRIARTFEKIFKLEWGVINNSNNSKKNLEKILEMKYNKVKWAGALAIGNPMGSCGLRS